MAVMNRALNDPYCSVAGNDASSGGSRVVNVDPVLGSVLSDCVLSYGDERSDW